MASLWLRFDPIEGEIDPEVSRLYRKRDFDAKYTNNPGALVDITKVLGSNPDFAATNFGPKPIRLMSLRPYDPFWLKMTEEERVENGLITKFRARTLNSFGFAASVLAMCNINKINLT